MSWEDVTEMSRQPCRCDVVQIRTGTRRCKVFTCIERLFLKTDKFIMTYGDGSVFYNQCHRKNGCLSMYYFSMLTSSRKCFPLLDLRDGVLFTSPEI